jgi:diamine N-acetyltransferase
MAKVGFCRFKIKEMIYLRRNDLMYNYKIIQLRFEDYYKCNNIWDMSKQPNTQKWYEELICGNRIIFIYTINGDFIAEGALVFDMGDTDYTISGQRVYVSRMVVKSEYRNKGIGGIMLNFLIEHAKQLGYKEMPLGVDIDNYNARYLYEKNGFSNVIFEGEDKYGKFVKLLKIL